MVRIIILVSIFIVIGALAIVGTEIRERRRSKGKTDKEPADEQCCGQHLVCERESLLRADDTIEYYDDEELDALKGKQANDYSREETEALENVFYSLREEDVAGWCRSLQARQIELPDHLREAALLIVRERRNAVKSAT